MKNCPNCNTANEDQSAFCSDCGHSLQDTATEAAAPENAAPNYDAAPTGEIQAETVEVASEPAKSPLDTVLGYAKKYAKFIVAGVAALLVIIIAVNLFTPAKFDLLEHSMSYVRNDDTTLILFDGKDAVRVDERVYPGANASQTACIYTTDDDTLYFVKLGDKKPTKIADDVSGAYFALNGDRVMYYVETDDGKDLYVTELGKSPKKVDSDVQSAAVSPDGKTVVYQKDDEHYVYNGKSSSLDISREASVELVSDGAKYIYYTRSGATYILKNKKDEVKLGDGVTPVMLNRDYSECLYTKDGSTYLSVNGKDGEKLVSDGSAYLYPENMRRLPRTLIGGIIRTSDKGLYRVGKNQDKTTKIGPRNAYPAVMAGDGESIGYYKSSSIYRQTNLKKEVDEPKALNRDYDVNDVAYSSDLKKIYFTDNSDDLYYVNGNGKPKKITYDVTDIYAGLSDGEFFVIKDNELYYSKNGSDLKKVSGLNGDFNSISVKAKHIIVETDEAYYRCTSGNKFKKICDK